MDITFTGTPNPWSALENTSETDKTVPAGSDETFASVNGQKVYRSSSHEFPVIPRSATTSNSDAVSLGHRNVSGRAGVAFGALAFSSFFMTAMSAPMPTTRAALAASAPTLSSALSNAASPALSTVSPNQTIEILRQGLEQVKEEVARLQVDVADVQGWVGHYSDQISELFRRSNSTDPLAAVTLVILGILLAILLIDRVRKL